MSRSWLPSFLRTAHRKPIVKTRASLALQSLESREVPTVSYSGGTYTQDFDTLITTGTGQPWANDSTIPGWVLFNKTPAAITTYSAGDGTSNSGTFNSFGTGTATDRALGGTASGGAYFGTAASGTVAGWIAVGVENATSSTIQTVTLNFNGEQWRNGGNATAQSMVLEYGFGTAFTDVTVWTAGGATFNWASPVATATSAAVDGNVAGRVSNVGGTLNGVNWQTGAANTLWVRWIENNDAGNDHGLGIDDFSLSTPVGNTPTSTAFPVDGVSPTTVNLGSPVTFKATVTSTSTPTLGTVQFRNGSASGPLLATADGTGSTTTATTRDFVVTTSSIPAGTYSNVNAYYVPGAGFDSSTTTAAFGTPLTVVAFATTVGIAPDLVNPTAGNTINYTLTFGSMGGGTPTGTYDYYANGLKLNATSLTIPGSGTANFSIGTSAIQAATNDKLTPGINHIEVRVAGTGLFLSSTKDYGQRVQAAAFGVGNVLVLRNNDGYNAPSVNGNRSYIDEFLPGTAGQTDPVQSIILPTLAVGANKPVLTSGQQSTDTQLTLSPDGLYAYFTAYNALPTNTLQLHTSSATAVPRVVGRLTLADGTLETSMALTDVASSGVYRSLAVTATGAIYLGGSAGGVRYIPGGYNAATTTTTDLGNGTIGFTNYTIAGSTPQLYAASPGNGTNPKVALIGGPGLPTSGTPTVVTLLQPADLVANATPKNPESVVFADLDATISYAGGIDTMYISEYGTTNLFSGGSITKWTWNEPGGPGTGFLWTNIGTVAANTAGTPNVDNNFTHMSGSQSGSTVNLVFANGGGGSNSGGAVWSLADTAGYGMTFSNPTPTLLYTTSNTSNKALRSVVQLPTGTAAPTVTNFTVNSGDPQRSRIKQIEVTFSGPVLAANFTALGAIKLTRTAVSSIPTGVIGDIVQTGPAAASHITVTQGTGSSLILTFDNNGSFTNNSIGVEAASLTDGYWQLNIGTFTSVLNSLELRRLYGDSTVSAGGVVDGADSIAFGNAYSSNNMAFDFNNDGTIDGSDLTNFGNRFSNSL